MVKSGFNERVAEAHGFKIVSDVDGTQRSIPVTPEAEALLRQGDQLRAQSQAIASDVDNCGSSWATGTKIANDTVAVNTGFQVFLAASEYDWTVYANGFITGNSWYTGGLGPASGYKNWNVGISNVVGPGWGGVPYASASASVILVDGTVCYSVGPTFTFN